MGNCRFYFSIRANLFPEAGIKTPEKNGLGVEKNGFRAYIDAGGDGRQPPVRKDWRKVRTPQSRESLG